MHLINVAHRSNTLLLHTIRQHFVACSRLIIISLLCNLLLPFFSSYPVLASNKTNALDLTQLDPSQYIIICSSNGIRVIDRSSFDDNSYHQKIDHYPLVQGLASTTDNQPSHYNCGLCLIAQLQLHFCHSYDTPTKLSSIVTPASPRQQYRSPIYNSSAAIKPQIPRAPPVHRS